MLEHLGLEITEVLFLTLAACLACRLLAIFLLCTPGNAPAPKQSNGQKAHISGVRPGNPASDYKGSVGRA